MLEVRFVLGPLGVLEVVVHPRIRANLLKPGWIETLTPPGYVVLNCLIILEERWIHDSC